MGFDLTGINPGGSPKPDAPDWTRKNNKEEKKAYFAWQTNTPGAYFRANVWGWRPIWDVVLHKCDDIITNEDYENGSVNDGYVINKEKALAISKRLKKLDISKICEAHNGYLESLPYEECDLCAGTGQRSSDNYQGDCNVCNTEYSKKQKIPVGKKKNWQCKYPLHKELLDEFIDFCEKSGGFEIW